MIGNQVGSNSIDSGGNFGGNLNYCTSLSKIHGFHVPRREDNYSSPYTVHPVHPLPLVHAMPQGQDKGDNPYLDAISPLRPLFWIMWKICKIFKIWKVLQLSYIQEPVSILQTVFIKRRGEGDHNFYKLPLYYIIFFVEDVSSHLETLVKDSCFISFKFTPPKHCLILIDIKKMIFLEPKICTIFKKNLLRIWGFYGG